ncbi:MAG: GNAT family N-acetyltransferase [Syntrophobacteraceae bacterium]|nr:GNAT family N-acetyltransferase [Syntrophobacteraceae bacterium]
MTSLVLAKETESRLTIRKAQDGDLEDVACLLTCLGYPLNPDELRSMYQTILHDPQMNVLLACLEHRAVGLITLRVFPSLRLNGFEVTIEELVVHPFCRGTGVGKTLLTRAVEYAKERGAVRLELHTSHKRESFKRRFYEKNGFSPAQSTLYRMDFREESGS